MCYPFSSTSFSCATDSPDDLSQRPAVSLEALAQDPPTDGFNRRNNPAKNNLVIGEKIDIHGP